MPTLERNALLRELGIEQYWPRVRGAAQAAVVPSPLPAPRVQTAPAVGSALRAAPTVAAAADHSLCFNGPPGWPGLRRHLLTAFRASERSVGAEIVFGGRGSRLSLPALGALAATPALKRHAWQALRALRRSAQPP